MKVQTSFKGYKFLKSKLKETVIAKLFIEEGTIEYDQKTNNDNSRVVSHVVTTQFLDLKLNNADITEAFPFYASCGNRTKYTLGDVTYARKEFDGKQADGLHLFDSIDNLMKYGKLMNIIE